MSFIDFFSRLGIYGGGCAGGCIQPESCACAEGATLPDLVGREVKFQISGFEDQGAESCCNFANWNGVVFGEFIEADPPNWELLTSSDCGTNDGVVAVSAPFSYLDLCGGGVPEGIYSRLVLGLQCTGICVQLQSGSDVDGWLSLEHQWDTAGMSPGESAEAVTALISGGVVELTRSYISACDPQTVTVAIVLQ